MKSLTKEETKKELIKKQNDWIIAKYLGIPRYKFSAVSIVVQEKKDFEKAVRMFLNSYTGFRKHIDKYITYLENVNDINILGFKISKDREPIHARVCFYRSNLINAEWISVNCKPAFCIQILAKKHRKHFRLYKKGEIYFIRLNEELN